MALGLIIKFQYHAWNQKDRGLITMDEHIKIVKKSGKVWWGRVTSISQDKSEELSARIEEGTPTYCFLYSTAVPKNIHEDGNLWYRARLIKVHTGTPEDKSLIPAYYRDAKLGVAFLIKDIEPITFKPSETPKVPGQAAIRYVDVQDDLLPQSLLKWDSKELITQASQSSPKTEPTKKIEITGVSSEAVDVVSLQQEIIDLQREVINLQSYKDYYNRIISTDYLFSSEKFMENWLEGNLHKLLPEIDILDRQPYIKWKDGKFGRLDLLGFNKDEQEISIIEVKTRKRNKRSGYDQFLRYTTWVKRNIDQLVKEYKLPPSAAKNGVGFVIITDHANDEMKAICSEYGIKIVRLFGGLGFEIIEG